MYNQLVDIDKSGNVFLQDHSIALMPKMWEVYKHKRMGSDMVRWIVCMDDYKSPYRRIPEESREVEVTGSIFGKKTHKLCSDKLVVEAREEYKMLQYDPLIDTYNAMTNQMRLSTIVYRGIKPTKKTLDELNDMAIKMQKAAESRNKIKEMIIKDQESESKISGTSSDDLSFMEGEQRREEDD